MPQVFHPVFNTFSKFSIVGVAGVIAAAVWVGMVVVRSPYYTGQDVVIAQPVPFSHAHHVGHVGIDCRYCHTAVEDSSSAGIPPTETCLGCHSQLYRDSPLLAPVRESYREERPLKWTRVHDLPDFTYFDHSIHVAKGVACTACHGDVNQMPLMWKNAPLTMQWCLDCHRHPHPAQGPPGDVFLGSRSRQTLETGHEPSRSRSRQTLDEQQKATLSAEASFALLNCSVCHR